MKKIAMLLITILFSVSLIAQDTWVKTYEPFGPNSAYYTTSNLVICPDSGFAFNGSFDMWTPEPGGYYTTNPYLIKTDSNGNLLWATDDFGNYYDNEGSICLAILEDGCFMVTVGKDLIKLSANAEYLWHISFDDPIFVPFSVDITNDQNIILGGVSAYQYPMSKKISPDGEILFSNSYEYNPSIDSQILSVKSTIDSCYLMTGWFKNDMQSPSDIIVIKTNSLGDSLWTKIIDTSPHDHATCITENPDNGNILISGYSFNPDYGILALLNHDGETIWIENDNLINSIYQNAVLYVMDNKYIVDANEMYCIDENYNLIWASDSKPSGHDKYIKILDDNYIVFTGLHSLPYNNHIASLSKANAEGNIVSIDNISQSSTESFFMTNCPNPFNLKTTVSFSIPKESNVEISIYNIKCQKINTITNEIYPKGNHQVNWNGDDESGNNVGLGIYFYKLNVNGKTVIVKKCLLLK